jgi:hypothetical protein
MGAFWDAMRSSGSFSFAVFARQTGYSPDTYTYHTWTEPVDDKAKHTGAHIIEYSDPAVWYKRFGLPTAHVDRARAEIQKAHTDRLARQQWRHEQYAAGLSRNAGQNISAPGGPAGRANPLDLRGHQPPGYQQVPHATYQSRWEQQ